MKYNFKWEQYDEEFLLVLGEVVVGEVQYHMHEQRPYRVYINLDMLDGLLPTTDYDTLEDAQAAIELVFSGWLDRIVIDTNSKFDEPAGV